MILYKPSKHAFFTDEESLTEPEHAESCDINVMMKRALSGSQIRGSLSVDQYGYDDTTMDALTLRIQKQQLEAELKESARSLELTEKEFALVPESIQKKFNFRKKSEEKTPAGTTPAAPSTQDALTQPKAP